MRTRATKPAAPAEPKVSDIDLGLAVLAVLFPGVPLSQTEIAQVCGCTPQYIGQLERRSIRKIRHAVGETSPAAFH